MPRTEGTLSEWKIKRRDGSTDAVEIVHSHNNCSSNMFHSDICVSCHKPIPKDLVILRNFMNLTSDRAKIFIEFRKQYNQENPL